MNPARRRTLVLAVLALAVVALLIAGRGDSSDTIRARTDRIAGSIMCPTCQGLSVAQSKADTAQAIYTEIERQVKAGQTDAQVRAYLVSRFGEQQLLRPENTGIGSIAWIAPVVVLVVGLAALVRVFRRSRPSTEAVTADDRLRVAEALRHLHNGSDQQS